MRFYPINAERLKIIESERAKMRQIATQNNNTAKAVTATLREQRGLTNAVDKYDIYPDKKTNEQGVQVRCYRVECGTWNRDSRFACKVIRTKTEQAGFN